MKTVCLTMALLALAACGDGAEDGRAREVVDVGGDVASDAVEVGGDVASDAVEVGDEAVEVADDAEVDAVEVADDADDAEVDAVEVADDADAIEVADDADEVADDAVEVEDDVAVELDTAEDTTPEPDTTPPSPVPFAVEGYGRNSVGGWQPGHDDYIVKSLDDAGPGTLREALDTATGPRVITFEVDGRIALTASLLVPSNVSIDGRGRAITLVGKGLILVGSDDVIVTHLTIEDVGPDSEDGLRIGDPTGGASERVVIDHVTFRATGDHGDSTNTDEAISVIFGSTDITFQWLRFEAWEKVMLFGNGDAAPAVDQAMRVTVHHTYAKDTGRRHPQARYGTFDFYNDFWDGWHMFDWFFASHFPESFGMQSQDGGFVMAEAILFRRSPGPYDVLSQADEATRCESGGRLEGKDLAVVPGGTATLKFGVGCPTVVAPWARPYPATIEQPDDALRLRLESETGARP